jgi:hypothetical protein
MNSLHPFPIEPPFRADDADRAFRLFLNARCPDRNFQFALLLPTSWQPVTAPCELPTAANPMGRLGLFRCQDQVTAEIEVSALLLQREVAPADVLDHWLAMLGDEILNRREADTPAGAAVDILCRTRTAGDPVVSRWLAAKTGKRLFLVQARAYETAYPRFADTFFMALTGFAPLHPSPWPLAESLRTFSRTRPCDFVMFYPDSWQLFQEPVCGDERLELVLAAKTGEIISGKISLIVLSRASVPGAQQLADNCIDKLARAGLPIRRLTLEPRPAGRGFQTMWQATGEANLTGGPVEVRLAVAEARDAWFLVGLLGAARHSDMAMWAINKRAFEIVVNGLRLGEVGQRGASPALVSKLPQPGIPKTPRGWLGRGADIALGFK